MKKPNDKTQLTVQEQAAFDRQSEFAEHQLDAILASIPDDVDRIGVFYCLWIEIAHVLLDAGWTGDELARDAVLHAASAKPTGRIQ